MLRWREMQQLTIYNKYNQWVLERPYDGVVVNVDKVYKRNKHERVTINRGYTIAVQK